MTGNECEALVEEFLEHHKLALNNGDVLNSDDLICKMILSKTSSSTSTSTDSPLNSSAISRLYHKHPSGYQEVNNFEFDNGSTTTRRKKREMSGSSNSVGVTTSTPSKSSSRGNTSSQDESHQVLKKKRR